MNTNTNIIIALGSNIEQESNMDYALELLRRLFGHISVTDKIWTEPMGIEVSADKFLNCIIVTESKHGYDQVYKAMKQIERKIGSYKSERRRGIVKIDIDILKFGNSIYHASDWERPYIQQLLKQVPVALLE